MEKGFWEQGASRRQQGARGSQGRGKSALSIYTGGGVQWHIKRGVLQLCTCTTPKRGS